MRKTAILIAMYTRKPQPLTVKALRKALAADKEPVLEAAFKKLHAETKHQPPPKKSLYYFNHKWLTREQFLALPVFGTGNPTPSPSPTPKPEK